MTRIRRTSTDVGRTHEPASKAPVQVISGAAGLVQHKVLGDRRHVLLKDSSGEVGGAREGQRSRRPAGPLHLGCSTAAVVYSTFSTVSTVSTVSTYRQLEHLALAALHTCTTSGTPLTSPPSPRNPQVALWDILEGCAVRSFGKVDFAAQEAALFQPISVSQWFSSDIKIGCLTVHLEQGTCFAAESYAMALGTDVGYN